MALTFRKITKLDYGRCAEIIVSAYKEEPWFNKWTMEEASLRVEATMSGFNARGFVAEVDGKVIAQCLGRIDYYNENWKQYVIDEFSIIASVQGQGIGTKFMNFVSTSLKEEQIDRVWLMTGAQMAANFYQKNGFEVSDEGIKMTLELKD